MAKILFYETGNFGGPFQGLWKNILTDFIDMIRRLEQSWGYHTIAFEDAETEAAFLVALFSRRMTAFILGGLTKHGKSALPQ